MKKLLLSSVFLFLLLLSTGNLYAQKQEWNGQAVAFAKGRGTQTDPYLIETSEHLAYLAQSVLDGETYKGKYLRLENDLYMGNPASVLMDLKAPGKLCFPGIGFYEEDSQVNHSKPFDGTFDGNNKTIDHLFVGFKKGDIAAARARGLFTVIGPNGVVKNVRIGEITFVSGQDAVGALCGVLQGRIERCASDAFLVMGEVQVGGLVGETASAAIIRDSYCRGNIAGWGNVGGLVGRFQYYSEVTNCFVLGELREASRTAGGLFGAFNTTTKVKNCYTAMKQRETLSPSLQFGSIAGMLYDETDLFKPINLFFDKDATRTEEAFPGEKFDLAIGLSTAEMTNGSFAARLGTAYEEDVKKINSGYPVLKGMPQYSYPTWTSTEQPIIDGDIRVFSSQGKIHIACDLLSITDVYTPNGNLVSRSTEQTINVPAGAYIVQTITYQGRRTNKVIVP